MPTAIVENSGATPAYFGSRRSWDPGDKMTEQPVEQCVRRLTELAQDPRFATRSDDFEALARDIATPDGDGWADVDLFAAFPADATTRLSHRNLLERVFGVFAGVSVFLPVAWTWWSFNRASEAYSRLIGEDGEPEGRTFLSLWTTGFEGRLQGWHQLVPMAFVSVLLIVFAILTLVAHRLIAGTNVRREEHAAQEAQTTLVSTLTQAQLILSTRRANHPLRVEGIIKSSMKKLREAHEAARQVIADLSVTSATVGASVRELVESAQLAGAETTKLMVQATELNASLNQAAERAEASVAASLSAVEGAVTSSLSTVGDAVASSLAAVEGATTSSVRSVQESMDASTQQLRDGLTSSLADFESSMAAGVGHMRDDAVAEIRQAGTTLQSVVDRIGASAERNAAAAGELTDQVGAMTDDNATTRAEFIAAIADVRSAVEGIESALLRHESALQGQASELTGARDSAERMLRLLTKMSGADGFVST